MTKRHGYALLAALAAVVVLISAVIFLGLGIDTQETETNTAAPRNSAAPASAENWVGTWSASPAAAEPNTPDGYTDMSIRNVVHTSIGGTSARIRLSNRYGSRPLTISHTTIALAAAPSDPTAAAGTMRRLTFAGQSSVTIPIGQSVISDPARLDVPAAADLLVTTYSPTPSGPVTYHPHARQTSYLAQGDQTENIEGTAYTEQTPSWRYLTGVDLLTDKARGAVVVLGDSITDGITSTTGANRRWTDHLTERLATEPAAPRYGVLNHGISGNRVLTDGDLFPPNNPSGQSRVGRDVLGSAGVRVVIVQLGVNDILRAPHQTDPQKITDGLRRIVQQAHARGLRVVGGTLLPFDGHRGVTPRLNAVREQVNAEIRSGRVFDDIVDFDAALRDPKRPKRLLPRYDSGDNLHPSDEGYRAMAYALDLEYLKGSASAQL